MSSLVRFCKQTLFVWIVTNGLWGNLAHIPSFSCLRKTEEVDIFCPTQFLVSTNLSVMELHVTHSMLMDMDKNLLEKQWAWRWQAWPPWHFAQRFGPQRILGTEQHPIQSSITFVRQSHCLSGCFGDFLVSTKDVSLLSIGNFNVYLPLCIKEEKLAAEKSIISSWFKTSAQRSQRNTHKYLEMQ